MKYKLRDACEKTGVEYQTALRLARARGIKFDKNPFSGTLSLGEAEFARLCDILKPPPPGYISVKEAAEFWSVATATIRTWIRRGKIPAVKVNGHKYNVYVSIEIPHETV